MHEDRWTSVCIVIIIIMNDRGKEMDKYAVGDIVTLKKQHPCGSKDWEILRVGADFRLKCMGCGHMVMISRKLVEKNDRGLKKAEEK